MKTESFRTINIDTEQEEVTIEIISNDKISFYASKLLSNGKPESGFRYSGKILFSGFVDYKSIELTAEEFDSLYDYYYNCEIKTRVAVKNKIVEEGEIELSKVL